jgi:hypothetical protein
MKCNWPAEGETADVLYGGQISVSSETAGTSTKSLTGWRINQPANQGADKLLDARVPATITPVIRRNAGAGLQGTRANTASNGPRKTRIHIVPEESPTGIV